MGSDNKTKGLEPTSSQTSFFKSKIFVSLLLVVIFFSIGYLIAPSSKPSKSNKNRPKKNVKGTTIKSKNKWWLIQLFKYLYAGTSSTAALFTFLKFRLDKKEVFVF